MLLHDTSASRPTIAASLDQIMRQVEYPCFANLRTGYIDPFYKEICLVISEVFLMNPDDTIKVSGSVTSIRLVQEIYTQLRNEHIRLVYVNFQGVSDRVYNKKAYLRSALYNSVFEIVSHFVNTDYADLPTD